MSQRSQLLDILRDVKTKVQDRLGNAEDFPLPQFVILGSQSSGKSRLIESFAGYTFNFVSGTLGSRRPTVLEFRHREDAKEALWYVQKPGETGWQQYSLQEVQKQVGSAHEMLGKTVSAVPVHVRLEGPNVPDMQVVDLPGFRSFADNADASALQKAIADLNESFMEDKNNIMICIEQAGDAANMEVLGRCKRFDPLHRRTILVRNKLDKYYGDLHSSNINQWMEGMGDIPPEVLKKTYTMSLPHWDTSQGQSCPGDFGKMLRERAAADLTQMREKNVSAKFEKMVGFDHFSQFMEREIETQFANSVQPVIQKLTELQNQMTTQKNSLEKAVTHSDPKAVVAMVRDVGVSFGHALSFVLEGVVSAKEGRQTLEEELIAFHDFHKSRGTYDERDLLPSEEFENLKGYVDYFRDELRCASFDFRLNGGAQFRRLMWEVEVFVRFAEVCEEVKKRDIIQARGVAMQVVGWRDVVVKILNKEAHLKMKARIRYVGERLKFFFKSQKEAVVEFMSSIRGSADEKLYSVLYAEHVEQLKNNPMVKEMVFDTFDKVVDRQFDSFVSLFQNTLCATFNNPWLFLKRGESGAGGPKDEDIEDVYLPTFDDIKARIKDEMQTGANVEQTINRWIADVPEEHEKLEDAVDKCSAILIQTFKFIRSQIADQAGLFGESFFKLPMLRRLEEDMCKIELHGHHVQQHQKQQEQHEAELQETITALDDVSACVQKLKQFAASFGSKKTSATDSFSPPARRSGRQA